MTNDFIFYMRIFQQGLIWGLLFWVYLVLIRYTALGGNGLVSAIKWIVFGVCLELGSSLLISPLNLHYTAYRADWLPWYLLFRMIVQTIFILVLTRSLYRIYKKRVLKTIGADKGEILDRLEHEQALSSRLKRYLNVVSHDLQTPLRTVVGYADIIIEDFKDVLDKQPVMIEDLGFIRGAALQMSALIDGLLEYTRLMNDENAIKFNMINLSECVSQALTGVQFDLDVSKSSVDINVSDLIFVKGHKEGLTTVFSNLINNALKFKNPDVPLRLKIKAESRGDHILVSVSDNGIGIKPNYQEKIFDIYQRLNPKMKGLGLGLAICREIIDQHGGVLDVKSKLGEGSTFFFTLPTR